MIRYTENTKAVLSFIQDYGFATIKIISNIMFKDNRNGKEQARVVLQKLVNNGDLIKWKTPERRECIYQFKKDKVSDHKYYLLNLYSEIYKLVDEVIYFKLEESWDLSKRRSDAHIVFSVGKVDKYYLVEFDKHHSTDISKYDEVYDSEEVQEWYEERCGERIFPDILVIDSAGKTKVKSERDYKVVCIDYSFTNLLKKVIL